MVVFGCYNADAGVYRLDWAGKEVWQARAGGSVLATPALTPACLVVASLQGELTGRAPESGALLWRISLSAPVFGSPLWLPGSACLLVPCLDQSWNTIRDTGVRAPAQEIFTSAT